MLLIRHAAVQVFMCALEYCLQGRQEQTELKESWRRRNLRLTVIDSFCYDVLKRGKKKPHAERQRSMAEAATNYYLLF